MMMEGAGFEVVDLGINNPAENYLDALLREDADILGMSALLTTTMPYMKVVIDTLKDRGLRDEFIVLVGGAPLNEEFGRAIGADAYCRDAAVAVETAKDFMARKHNQIRRPGMTLPADRTLTEEGLAAPESAGGRVLVIACGALAREILALKAAERLGAPRPAMPARRSSTSGPTASPTRSRRRWPRRARATADIFVAYADCGTGGLLAARCAALGVEMIAGPHCYSFFDGNAAFAARGEDEMRAFYLTDFLVRQFDAFVWRPMGLDRHPELRDMLFGNYDQLVYLAQTDDPALDAEAERCAARLGLSYARRFTGYGDLAPALGALGGGEAPASGG